MSDLLTWKDSRYNIKTGSAGKVLLFTIALHTRRDDPDWLMHCGLPGYTGREWKDDDADALKAAAESILATWLAKVGGLRSAALSAAEAAFDVWLTGDGPLQPGYDPESPTQLKTRADVVVHLAEAYTAGWLARGGDSG